jgi:hypothetical protein
MPVHLFGRPAPLEELAQLGVPIDRGRGAGVRRAGVAHGRRVDLQLLPDEEPLRARRRRPRRRQRRGARERVRMLRFHGSRDKVDFELVGYNSRLDELQAAACASSCRSSTVERGCAARRPRATRARLGELVRAAGGRAGPRLPPVRRAARPSATARAALKEAGIGFASYYVTPLHLQPALRYLGYEEGSLPGDRARARENFSCRCGPASTEEQQERVVSVVRAPRRRRVVMTIPVNRHRLWQLARRRGPDRARVVARVLSCASTRRAASTTDTLLRRTTSLVVAIKLASSSSSASTTAGGATSRRATCGAPRAASRRVARRRPRRLLRRRSHGSRLPRSIARHRLAAPARVRRRLAPARAHADRAAGAGRLVARGKEVLVVGAGDAGQLIVREMQRNPQLGYTPIGLVDDDPRKKNLRIHGVRVLGTTTSCRTSCATTAGRGADRDPVRVGRGAPAVVETRARGRPGEDAAGPATS